MVKSLLLTRKFMEGTSFNPMRGLFVLSQALLQNGVNSVQLFHFIKALVLYTKDSELLTK